MFIETYRLQQKYIEDNVKFTLNNPTPITVPTAVIQVA